MKRLAAGLIPVLLLAGCGPSGEQRTTRLLDQRLGTTLRPDIASGRAAVEATPQGVRVTLLGSSLLPNNDKVMEDQAPDVRADLIEGLLDPRLMRVQVTDTSALPADQQAVRVSNVEQYFTNNGLGSVVEPAGVEPAGAAAAGTAPAGLVVTIRVQCPPPDGYIGYRNGISRPVCE